MDSNQPKAPPQESSKLEGYQATSPIASWVFGGLILVFLMIVVFVPIEPTKFPIDRFLMALSAAFFAIFFVGGVLLRGTLNGLFISATGGFVLFILIAFVFDPFKFSPTLESRNSLDGNSISSLASSPTAGATKPEISPPPNNRRNPSPGGSPQNMSQANSQLQSEGNVSPRQSPVLFPTSPGVPEFASRRSVRYDGFYRSASEGHWLRFYEDGTVIGQNIMGPATAKEVARWFKKPYDNTGQHTISGSVIEFSLTSKEGRVSYKGTVINNNSLQLSWYSYINQHKGAGYYEFTGPN